MWLQETWVSESKHTVTHFVFSMPGRMGLYSHVWYFKMRCPHLHFRKILCWQTFTPPETDFKREVVCRGKTPFSKGFFVLSLAPASHFFGLNFSFQQFHIMCLAICLPSINQINERGQKPGHGRNGFAAESSEGQFWLCSELCAVGFRTSTDNMVIPWDLQLNVFSLCGPGSACYTECTSHCSGLCNADCSEWVCCSCC